MSKVYGYVRISTKKQSIDRQIRNIQKEFPDAHIVQEVFTGTTADRKEFKKLLGRVKSGDTIVFDSVSRMSRNATEGIDLYKKLYSEGVELVFLKERHIDTFTYKNALNNQIKLTNSNVDFILDGVNKYLLALAEEQIKIAFDQSEKEVLDLRQRTREGIETARLNGKSIGLQKGTKLTTKKSIEAKEIIQKYSKDFNGTLADADVMKLASISRNTYYKYKSQLKNELF